MFIDNVWLQLRPTHPWGFRWAIDYGWLFIALFWAMLKAGLMLGVVEIDGAGVGDRGKIVIASVRVKIKINSIMV